MNPQEIENILHREGLSLAPISKRLGAFFLDELLLSLLLIVTFWESFSQAKTTLESLYVAQQFSLEYAAITIIYHTLFVYKYGASLGKIAMRIRVVELPTLQNPSLLSAFNRAVFRVVSQTLFYLGFVWGVMDPFRRTWHDLSARTIVIES